MKGLISTLNRIDRMVSVAAFKNLDFLPSWKGAKELVVHLLENPNSYKDMYLAMKFIVENKRNKLVQNIIVIFPNNDVRHYDRNRFK